MFQAQVLDLKTNQAPLNKISLGQSILVQTFLGFFRAKIIELEDNKATAQFGDNFCQLFFDGQKWFGNYKIFHQEIL